MALPAPTKTTSSITTPPEFALDVYATVAPAELVVFAVQTLQKDGLPAATEEIVSTCFRLFPHHFSLKNYFYWPDSASIMLYLNEAKEKGDLKGKPADGFALKVQGRQTVKRVAKILGVTLPAPEKEIKKISPVSVIKKAEPVKPKVKKKAKVSQEKKPTIPVVKKKPAAKKVTTPVKKVATKKAVPKKTAASSAPVPVKKTAPKVIAKKAVPKKTVAPPATPAVKKSAPKAKPKEKKKPAAPVPQKKAVVIAKKEIAPKKKPQPKQLTLLPPVVEAKKTAPENRSKPKVKKEAQVVKSQPVKVSAPVASIAVSKEEKAKAGKVMHMLERSDAYRQYKKNGSKAKISEFDFRNMLFATMESSAETLKRNVELFKRYAGIQSRADLAAFLNFCEASFAGMLKPSAKKTGKRK